MDDVSHAYAVLGLAADAPLEQVKQTYRDLVRVWHPDRFNHDERLRHIAQEKLKQINGAYQVLEAHFFAAGTTTETAPLSDTASPPPAASPEKEKETRPAPRRYPLRRAGIVSAAVLVIAAGTVLVLKRGSFPGSAAPRSAGDGAAGAPAQYALSFEGGGSSVVLATTGSLAGTYTVECWALTRRRRATETILSSRGPRDFSFGVKFREGRRFHGDIGDGSRWLAKMANASFRYLSGTWYHVAYVVTPAEYRIFVNGELAGSGSIPPGSSPLLYDATHPLRLGTDGIDQTGLDGCIAEIRLWNTARTADQIKAAMNQPLAGTEPGLQGYWRFNEGSGPTAADSSGHGFTGMLIGSVTWTTNGPPLTR